MYPRRHFYEKTLSIVLAVALISIIFVSALPSLAKQGRNFTLKVIGILCNGMSIVFLAYEVRSVSRARGLIGRLNLRIRSFARRIFQSFFCLPFRNLQGVQNDIEEENHPLDTTHTRREPVPFKKHNFLAFFFFIGYFWTESWRLIDEIHFFVTSDECASLIGFVYDATKLCFSMILMDAIIASQYKFGERKKNLVSYIGWCCTAAVCFSSAVKYVIQDLIFAYVDFCENSDIEPSITTDFMTPIVKNVKLCSVHAVLPNYNILNMEIMASFGTEFFSLAAFFSLVTWRNLELENEEVVSIEHMEIENDDNPIPEEPPLLYHRCTAACVFSIDMKTGITGIIFVGFLGCIFISYFFNLMNSKNYLGGIWIQFFQNFVFHTTIFVLELSYYVCHLRKMKPNPKVPQEFHLDLVLLLFTLFPLGIFYSLLELPDIVQLFSHQEPGSAGIGRVIMETFNVILQWSQMAFQGIFVSEIFCTADKSALGVSKYLFLILAGLNICLWLSWSLESKLITLYGRYAEMYGVIGAILIAYSTLPFFLFNLAHVTTVFLEFFLKF